MVAKAPVDFKLPLQRSQEVPRVLLLALALSLQLPED